MWCAVFLYDSVTLLAQAVLELAVQSRLAPNSQQFSRPTFPNAGVTGCVVGVFVVVLLFKFLFNVSQSLTQKCPVGSHSWGAHMWNPTTIRFLPVSHLTDAPESSWTSSFLNSLHSQCALGTWMGTGGKPACLKKPKKKRQQNTLL